MRLSKVFGKERALIILEEKEAALVNTIEDSRRRLKEVRRELSTLRGTARFPWMERSVELLRNENQLMTTDELLKAAFVDRLDELEDVERRRGHITSLSVALNKLYKAGRLNVKKEKGIKGSFYGLTEWWQNDELQVFYKMRLQAKILELSNVGIKRNAPVGASN